MPNLVHCLTIFGGLVDYVSFLSFYQLSEYARGFHGQVNHLILSILADIEVHSNLFDQDDGFYGAHLLQLSTDSIAHLVLVYVGRRHLEKLLTEGVRVGTRLRLVKLKLLLCSIVLKSRGCGEPALVRCNVRHVSKLALAERITEVSTRLRLIRVDLHELLELAADHLVFCLC